MLIGCSAARFCAAVRHSRDRMVEADGERKAV
jgi:hypothetical protein